MVRVLGGRLLIADLGPTLGRSRDQPAWLVMSFGLRAMHDRRPAVGRRSVSSRPAVDKRSAIVWQSVSGRSAVGG